MSDASSRGTMMSQEYFVNLPLVLASYYERLALDGGDEEWQRGLEIAREWQRLAIMNTPDPDAVRELLDRVVAEKNEGSAWMELESGIQQWQNATRSELYGSSSLLHNHRSLVAS